MNTSLAATVVLALAAPATMAFQQASNNNRPSTALNSLRDIASYPDDMKMMSEFEAFDRNGAFSRSPQGGYGGRSDNMMYGGGMNPNPFSRRGGGGDDRMYTRDGFDPYSAYGNSFGMSQSDNRRGGPRGGGMDYYGGPPDMMMMGGPRGGGMMMNGVKADNTMGGFDYSSRNRDYGYGGGMPYGGGMNMMSPYDYDGGFDGPPMGMGGGEMGYDQGGGYGGFVDGDMSRLGP